MLKLDRRALVEAVIYNGPNCNVYMVHTRQGDIDPEIGIVSKHCVEGHSVLTSCRKGICTTDEVRRLQLVSESKTPVIDIIRS